MACIFFTIYTHAQTQTYFMLLLFLLHCFLRINIKTIKKKRLTFKENCIQRTHKSFMPHSFIKLPFHITYKDMENQIT